MFLRMLQVTQTTHLKILVYTSNTNYTIICLVTQNCTKKSVFISTGSYCLLCLYDKPMRDIDAKPIKVFQQEHGKRLCVLQAPVWKLSYLTLWIFNFFFLFKVSFFILLPKFFDQHSTALKLPIALSFSIVTVTPHCIAWYPKNK